MLENVLQTLCLTANPHILLVNMLLLMRSLKRLKGPAASANTSQNKPAKYDKNIYDV